MKRAAIYARFSTDLQNERSIEDQITLCRDYTSREGMNVVEVYEDKARSGGSVMGRGGLLPLLDEARDQSFDVVVVEALDRLSCDMEDLAGIHKRLSFLGIEIRAVHEGVVNSVLVGLRGLLGQLYREDNAHKVRRGLAGRVGQGLNAGGRAYGYVPVVGDKGKRVIVEGEAEIVRRIFDEYVAGRTPREIAHDPNNEGVSPPRGRSGNASTINGNMQRGTGIIQNELYAGRLVWNKVRWSKTLIRASDCRVRTPRTTGRPLTCRICALSLRNYLTKHKVASRRVAIHIQISSEDRATCCRVSSDAGPVAQGCPRTGRTIQDAFASAVQPPRKAVPAKTQRLSTLKPSRAPFLRDWKMRCGTHRLLPNMCAPT
jgi:DNA invertase Pin-like site-specific DNA recombinase